MEFVFAIISIIMTVLFIYGIWRTVYSHKEIIREYREMGEELIAIKSFIALLLAFVFWITLCAFNNTFWHLPYITA